MIKSLIKNIIPAPIWTYLRLKKLKTKLEKFESYIVEHSYCGYILKIVIADELAQGWYDHDWKKLPEVEFLKNKIQKKDALIFDIGAHQGIVAQVLAKTAGTTGKVIAIEANPHNAKIMKENCKLNNISNLETIHAAIAEKDGELYFNEGLNGGVDPGNGEWGRVKTEAICIDTLVERFGIPDLIFLDVEGFELKALEGAKKNFSKIKNWFIEVHAEFQLQSHGGSVNEVFNYFPEANYTCFISYDADDHFEELSTKGSLDQLIKSRFFLIAIQK